jgi:hypothetical protein
MSEKDIDLAALDLDLQKLKKPQRGWFGRNWKWFVPVFLLLVVVIGGGVGYYMIYQRVFNHEAYQQAMAKILENKEIKEFLGEPIKTKMSNPGPTLRQEATETNILWTIVGSTGKEAKARVFQRLNTTSGKWETVTAEVTLPGKRPISLVEEEEGEGPPPFQPPAASPANANPPDKAKEEDLPEDLTPNIPSPEESK